MLIQHVQNNKIEHKVHSTRLYNILKQQSNRRIKSFQRSEERKGESNTMEVTPRKNTALKYNVKILYGSFTQKIYNLKIPQIENITQHLHTGGNTTQTI